MARQFVSRFRVTPAFFKQGQAQPAVAFRALEAWPVQLRAVSRGSRAVEVASALLRDMPLRLRDDGLEDQSERAQQRRHHERLRQVLMEASKRKCFWEAIDAWLEELEETQVAPTVHNFTFIMRHVPRALQGRVDQGAVDTTRAVMDRALALGVLPNARMMNAFLHVCKSGKDLKTALEYLDRMLRPAAENELRMSPPNVMTFNIVLEACAKTHAREIAEDVMAKMRGYGLQPDVETYTAMIRLAQSQAQADEVLQEMESVGLPGDTVAYSVAMQVCSKMMDLPGMWHFFHLMESKGVEPDEDTFTILAELYAECGDFERVSALLGESRALGFKPREREYHCFLKACLTSRVPDCATHAEQALRCMLEDGVAFDGRVITLANHTIGRATVAEILRQYRYSRP